MNTILHEYYLHMNAINNSISTAEFIKKIIKLRMYKNIKNKLSNGRRTVLFIFKLLTYS